MTREELQEKLIQWKYTDYSGPKQRDEVLEVILNDASTHQEPGQTCPDGPGKYQGPGDYEITARVSIKPRFPSDTIYQGDREICSINYLEATFRKIEAKG